MLATCPAADQIHDLSLGKLGDEESESLFAHIQQCSDCAAALSEMDPPVDDTLVGQLRDGTIDESYTSESNLRVAMARALGALAVAETPEEPDEKLPKSIGEYEIVRRIGQGGMGTVYLANHTKLNRLVALKVLAGHRLSDPRMHGRFQSEMRAVGGLSHPNIVTAHDAREVDGLAVLVTEWIDGLDTSEMVRRLGAMEVNEACEIAKQTAVALKYIDSQHLVHRDIKPSNIMISRDGDVKVLDLGLARFQSGEEAGAEATATGQALGTADYIAPEQINSARSADIRADIYSLGCALYKWLTGEAPFASAETPFAKMTAHVSETPKSLRMVAPHVPAAVAKLVDKMLAKDLDLRPQSIDDVIKTLDAYSGNADLRQLAIKAEQCMPSPTGPPPVRTFAEPAARGLKRRVPVSAAIAAGLIGLIAGLLLGIVIKINHPNGTQSTIRAEDGSDIKVDGQGNVEVTPPNASKRTRTPSKGGGMGGMSGMGMGGEMGGDMGGMGMGGMEMGAEDMGMDMGMGMGAMGEMGSMGMGMAPAPDLSQQLKYLVGSWKITDSKVSGDSVPVNDSRWVFSDDAQVFITGRQRDVGLFKLLPNQQFEFVSQKTPARRTAKYQWVTNPASTLAILQVCIGADGKAPTDFSSTKQNGQTVILMTREQGLATEMASPKAELTITPSPPVAVVVKERPSFLGQLFAGPRIAAQAAQSKNNLKQIAIAFHNFHDVYKKMPASQHVMQEDKKDLPPHSWRVALLPFIDQANLYQQYRLNEPWDSANNLKVLAQMPDTYRHPTQPKNSTTACYVGIVGDNTGIGKSIPTRFRDVTDGTSNTLLVIEAQTNIPWTKPEDISFADPHAVSRAMTSGFASDINFALMDGSVRSLPKPIDTATFQALITRNGGERVLLQYGAKKRGSK